MKDIFDDENSSIYLKSYEIIVISESSGFLGKIYYFNYFFLNYYILK